MILIIIFLGIILLMSTIFFIICLSNLEIEIKRFDYNSIKNKEIKDYLVYIRLKLFKKITWFKLTVDDDRVNKLRKSKIAKAKILKRVLLKNEKKIFTIQNIKHMQKFEINRFNLRMEIGVIDIMLTSYVVAIISVFVSIILAKGINNYDSKEISYKITPIYKENIQINISFNCIFNVQMVHIINILYMLFKQRSVEYDERTSNRRTYVCSNE